MLIVVALGLCCLMAFAAQPPATPVRASSIQSDATLTVEPESPTIDGCETRRVEIWVNDVVELYGADLRLSFDPALLEVVQIKSGGFLKEPLFLALNRFDNSAGTIEWAATQLNPTLPQSGSGALLTIEFRAKSKGTSPLAFVYSKLAGIGGVDIPATATDGSVGTIPPTSPSLSIARVLPTTARLTWTEGFAGAEYHLYRDTMPYFAPTSTPYHTTTGSSYDDAGALGDTVIQHYYVVRAACANGFESENSNRVGEYDYPLTSANMGNMNDIAMVLIMPDVPDAKALAAYLGSSVLYVSRYDIDSQSFESYLVGIDSTNFDLVTGEFVFLTTNSSTPPSVAIVGRVPEPGSVSFLLASESPSKQNFVSLPLDRDDLIGALDVAADLGTGVLYVSRYDIDSQTFELCLPPNIGDFPLAIGEPFVLTLGTGAPVQWPH